VIVKSDIAARQLAMQMVGRVDDHGLNIVAECIGEIRRSSWSRLACGRKPFGGS